MAVHADLQDGPLLGAERLPCRFGETDFVPSEKFAIDLIKRCRNRLVAVADIDLGMCGKALGTAAARNLAGSGRCSAIRVISCNRVGQSAWTVSWQTGLSVRITATSSWCVCK